ncbi:MAG: NADH-quinone oxidoreductase subunit J [Cytophagales bacterium]|nr:MAG: NADH-quinone oxidoreductase subunit J [Cytophagales bacterium]
MNNILFLSLSLVSIFSAIMVIFSKNPMYSILFLVLTFFTLAGHFAIFLGAEFLAIVNIIVYAGAIMVLFLFVVMLLNLNKESEPNTPMISKIAAIIAGGMFLLVLFSALTNQIYAPEPLYTKAGEIGLVKNLGKILFDEYLIPFEISSVLFLSAMVGAVMLGKKDLKQG